MGAAPDVARQWFATRRGIAALWVGIVAGPSAWALDLLISYAVVQWTCGGGPPMVLHLISMAALLLIAGGAFVSWSALHYAPGGDLDQPDQRGRFMALLGLSMCGLFALVVIATAVPRWVLDACHQ